jgi:hypothetical protein
LDNRPYPRTELCACCERREVDVIGPGDTMALCIYCHLELMAEQETTIAQAYRFEDFLRGAMADPDASDDAISDTVAAIRRR